MYLLNLIPSNNNLFKEYFKPYPNVIPIVRGEGSIDNLKIAMIEYESANYSEALKVLNRIIDEEPENVASHFYSGNANLCINNPEQAIIHFEKVLSLGKNNFKDQAEWYLGLTYLKINDFEKAGLIFGKIASKDHAYRQQSLELLEQIKD